ncbi:MAG: M48 family metalloprotease [Hyphomonadaceae bacterium]
MRWAVSSALALVLAATSMDAHAQLRLPFGGRDEAPTSLLATLDGEEITQRCSAPPGEVTEEGLETYDLIDTLAGAPDAARFGGSVTGSQRTDATLSRILDRLVSVRPPPAGVTPTVHVQDTMDIDARQSSAGQILITAGLMDALQSREGITPDRLTSEYAFILAHEYSHVLLCHYNRTTQVSRTRRALRTASSVGALVVMLSNSTATRNAQGGYTVNTDAQGASDDYLTVMAGLTLLRTFNSSIVNPAWGRQQERDADRLAVELMAEAGFSTAYVGELLNSLFAADDATTNSFSQILQQVPGQAAGALALSLNQQNQGGSFRQMMTAVGVNAGVQAFQQWRTNQLRHFHDEPERRINWINPMIEFRSAGNADRDRALLAENNPFLEDTGTALASFSTSELQAPEYAREANRLFAENNTDGGCAAADQALAAGPTSVQALFVGGNCQLRRNNIPRAARHLDAVLASRYATPDDFTQVASMWREAEQRPRAEAALAAGTARFGADRYYIPRMQFYASFQEHDAVQRVAAECAAANTVQSVKDECARTARDLQPQPAEGQGGNNPFGNLIRAGQGAIGSVTGQEQQPQNGGN